MCCWLYRNGRVTPLRLVEDAAKEYCRNNAGYTLKTCREVDADRAVRNMELLFRQARDFNVVDVPQDVDRMLAELHDGGAYTGAEPPPQTAARLEPTQPEWYGIKRAEKNREWNYTRMSLAVGYDTHYFKCNELIRSGVYECKHFDCKCPCHHNNTARAACLWLSKRGDPHTDCACACHLTA